jgi:UDP-N-acetylmuramoyl-L-alanyl-D-glutamate--2,6-diaminopimelate ligase
MGVFISGKLLYKCENTTPSAEIIFSAMKEARERGVGYVVLEVSSQAVLKDRVAGLRFELCVFTGFSPDHVGGSEHASMEDYFECKRRIFTDHGANIAVVNADDERAADIASGISEVIGCTSRTNGKMQISDIETHKSGIRFILNGTSVSLSMLGEYNAMNAALALSAASRLMGKEVASFLAAIERVRLKGRFERYAVGGAEVVIDFAHNGDSFRAVLGAAARLYPGRIIALFGSVGERSLQRRAELAAEAERAADFSIITSDDPGREPPEKIAGQIYSAFSDRSRAVVITDREAAIRYGVSMLGDGDALLLLGKGQEEYQMIGFERIRFSEREIIASLGAVPI